VKLIVYEDTRGSGRCRACDASIIWVETVAGKRMPLDPPWRPIHTGSQVQGRALVEIDTAVTTTHFATCPHADRFRRKRSSHA
jgi:hypothetical protein